MRKITAKTQPKPIRSFDMVYELPDGTLVSKGWSWQSEFAKTHIPTHAIVVQMNGKWIVWDFFCGEPTEQQISKLNNTFSQYPVVHVEILAEAK